LLDVEPLAFGALAPPERHNVTSINYDFMTSDKPQKSGRLVAPAHSQPAISRVLTGAAGLTKAALRVDRADEVLIRKRRSVCAACPQATAGLSKTSRCQVCTCFIYPKTATATEECPAGRW
jgi:hypothetical protein